MILLKDITFGYNDNPVIKNLSLKIDDNQFITITGPNGSGKTTFGLILAGILKPQSGNILIDNPYQENPDNYVTHHRVGIVFENPDNQFITTSVERELAFGLENLGVKTSEIKQRVNDTLRLFHIERLRNRSPHNLSGGEKQKVAIAAIFILNPSCIVFDEPTVYLDPISRMEVLATIQKLRGNITIILISHIPEELLLGEKIYLLAEGKLSLIDNSEIIHRSNTLQFLDILYKNRLCHTHFPIPPEELCDDIEHSKRESAKIDET